MKISIVIPIYNMGDSLEKCVKSISSSQNKDVQIILVDDGSTDNSYQLCKQLEKEDDRICVVHQENQGSGPARNAGIKEATGDYTLFIDSDDCLNENAVEKLLAVAQECQADIIIYGYRLISPSGKETEKRFEERKLTGREVRSDYCPYFNNQFTWAIQGAPWNKLFKTALIKDNNIVFPSLRRHQDEVFISRAVSCSDSIMFTDLVLYTHYANDARKLWRKYPDDYFDIVNELYSLRQNIIEKWNPDNKKIKALTYSEYINNTFRAAFKLFDDSKKITYSERKKFYKDIKRRFVFLKTDYPSEYIGIIKRMQNKLFVYFLSHKCYLLLDCLIQTRLAVFKRG